MIQIRRGREPASLPPVRRTELANARALYAAGTLNKDNIGTGYYTVRGDLCSAQHCKCCYCERNNFEASYNDVEHYRPKLRADRGPGLAVHGYWWLAWTWQNLMFACPVCNRTCKRDQFPIGPGSTPLVPEQSPPLSEVPLLIDPCRENPINHIKFTYYSGLPKHRWRPLPRNGSTKGDHTIRVAGLNRPGLLDLYDRHVSDHIEPIATRLRAEIATGNGPGIAAIWSNDAVKWLKPGRPLTALSYDALDHYIPLAERRRWGLPLRRPI